MDSKVCLQKDTDRLSLQVCPTLGHKVFYPTEAVTKAGIKELAAIGSIPKHLLSHQEELPRYLIPPLQQTLDRFISSTTPLLSDDELVHAKELVGTFGKPGGEGERLQVLLERKAQGTINWVSHIIKFLLALEDLTFKMEDWWINLTYLEFRLPLTVHLSPCIKCPVQNFSGKEGQLSYTAKLLSGILEYKKMVDDHTLPIDKPLCMKQFYHILGCCRVPAPKRDHIAIFPGDSSKHFTVVHNNHYYEVAAYGSDGKPVNTEQFYEQLVSVCEQSQTKGPPLGILTSDNRDNWAEAHDQLMKDQNNQRHLESIERSILVVCLDQQMPVQSESQRDSVILNQMNHGGGSHLNSPNRWNDKILQMIVGPDGHVGFNFEHSTAEGLPIMTLADFVLQRVTVTKGLPTFPPAQSVSKPTRLDFNIPASVESAMNVACQSLDVLVADLDMVYFCFDGYGTNFPKSQKLSPDAFLQVAYQLAFYKLYGHSTATYESGSLRRFRHGRTDTIRSCSIASDAYCKSMGQDSSASTAERAQKLRDAVQAHRTYTDWVVAGQGIDRHLLGLKLIALEHGQKVPDLLMDLVYTKSCKWQINTSQVTSKSGCLPGYRPAVFNGYGICYNPMEDKLLFSISAWRSCPETDATKFSESLCEALQDAKRVLLESGTGAKL